MTIQKLVIQVKLGNQLPKLILKKPLLTPEKNKLETNQLEMQLEK